MYYSFLTLDNKPNSTPNEKQWAGDALYDTETLLPIDTIMTGSGYQRTAIEDIMDQCQQQGKLFMWAFGGWSDLTLTISDEQIPTLVDKLVQLLGFGGDGVDFDWEHLSASADVAVLAQQRAVLGKTISALRHKLTEKKMGPKYISYTTRFNCFWNSTSRPNTIKGFESDGECLDTISNMKAESDLDWINLMIYDAGGAFVNTDVPYFTLDHFKAIAEAGSTVVDKSKIILGFEPGAQVGVWEGFDIDFQVVDYAKRENLRGVMFWSMNLPTSTKNSNTPSSKIHPWQGNMARNAQYMAAEIKGKPLPPSPLPPPPADCGTCLAKKRQLFSQNLGGTMQSRI